MYPAAQVHVNPFTMSLHVALFRQGELSHSLISLKIDKKERLVFKHIYGKSLQFTYIVTVGNLILRRSFAALSVHYKYDALMNCDLLVPVSQFLSVYPGEHVQE